MSARHRERIQRRLRILILSGLITVLIGEVAALRLAPVKLAPAGETAALSFPQLSSPAEFRRYTGAISGDVFAESRQPPGRVLARVATPPPEEASTFRVVATVVAENVRVALVELPGSTQPQRVHVGDLIGGRRVMAIGATSITIDSNGLGEVLAISHKGAGGVAGTAEPGSGMVSATHLSATQGETPNRAAWAAQSRAAAAPRPPISNLSDGR